MQNILAQFQQQHKDNGAVSVAGTLPEHCVRLRKDLVSSAPRTTTQRDEMQPQKRRRGEKTSNGSKLKKVRAEYRRRSRGGEGGGAVLFVLRHSHAVSPAPSSASPLHPPPAPWRCHKGVAPPTNRKKAISAAAVVVGGVASQTARRRGRRGRVGRSGTSRRRGGRGQ